MIVRGRRSRSSSDHPETWPGEATDRQMPIIYITCNCCRFACLLFVLYILRFLFVCSLAIMSHIKQHAPVSTSHTCFFELLSTFALLYCFLATRGPSVLGPPVMTLCQLAKTRYLQLLLDNNVKLLILFYDRRGT